MRTIKIPSTSARGALLLLAAVLLAGGAHAQATGGSRAERLEWPRTFSGTPDFIFARDEAISQARADAARNGVPLPLVPSLGVLIEDDSQLDPLRILVPVKTAVSQTELVSGTGQVTDVLTSGRQSLMDKLMAQAIDLPVVAASAEPDLTQFRNQLGATLTRAVEKWEPDAARYSFGSALSTLVLQAIVTSPVSYAVINQQRYEVGDTFRISIPMRVPEAVLAQALNAQMPAPGTLSPALEANYSKAYDEALQQFATERAQKPEIGYKTLVLPVQVTSISRREVMLDLNGAPYVLTIRYAY